MASWPKRPHLAGRDLEVIEMIAVTGLKIVGKWVLTLLMLLGRLEVFSVLVLLVPLAWKH